MSRIRIGWAVVLAVCFAGGEAVMQGVVPGAAAEERNPPSLSGVLAVPSQAPPGSSMKDPFRPVIAPRVPERETDDEQRRAMELPPLQLTAILQGPGRAAAVVNGTILRPGDAFLDMLVLEIVNNRVLFQRGDGKVTVFMQENLYNPLLPGGK